MPSKATSRRARQPAANPRRNSTRRTGRTARTGRTSTEPRGRLSRSRGADGRLARSNESEAATGRGRRTRRADAQQIQPPAGGWRDLGPGHRSYRRVGRARYAADLRREPTAEAPDRYGPGWGAQSEFREVSRAARPPRGYRQSSAPAARTGRDRRRRR